MADSAEATTSGAQLHDHDHKNNTQTEPTTVDDSLMTGADSTLVEEDDKVPDVLHKLSSQTQTASSSQNSFSSKALKLLSTVTPTTLAGIAVGFAATTYAILGQFGLVVIGAVGGVISFIIWEGRNPEIARAVRGEQGPDALERLWLDLKEIRPAKAEEVEDEDDESVMKGLDDLRPQTRDALSGLVDAVVRDYVKWWYNPIIPTDHSFPLACRKGLTSYIMAVSNRMSRKRPADAFLDLLTNSSSIAIAFMSELAAAFADVPPESNMTAVDAVYNYLASNPESRLSSLLDQRQQSAKFRMVAEDLLSFMEKSTTDCDPARIFLREILANSVLENMLQICSKPEWINGWIVYLLEAGEPDLSQAIDSGMQTARDTVNNVFADLDGNVGNIGIAKPGRFSGELERGRRKESQAHKKKLSKADEEMEEAISEMKRMNQLIAKDESRHSMTIESPGRSSPSMDLSAIDAEATTTEARAESQKAGKHSEKQSPRSMTDSFSTNEPTFTPVTPRSTMDTSSQGSTSPHQTTETQEKPSFTNFEQIVPEADEKLEENGAEAQKKEPLTLHNASFTILDDGSTDTNRIKTKPNWDYLIQIEPSSADHSGWMIVRRYSDFETLHEILRRIANVSGATAFTELHKELPSWKIHIRESLRGELERYLRDACWYQSLAESEGMKRFLEKSQGHTHGNNKAFAWDSVGKNMLDVLTVAPKGAMEGGKMLVGGVTGVFGNFPGMARKSTSQSVDLSPNPSRLSISTPSRAETMRSSPARSERTSMDSQRSSVVSTQPGRMAPMERMDRRGSYQFMTDSDGDMVRMGRSDRMDATNSASASARPSREHSRASSLAPIRSPSSLSLDYVKLPPPPDEITDDYESPTNANPTMESTMSLNEIIAPVTTSNTAVTTGGTIKRAAPKVPKLHSQMTEGETRVAVELLFAVINEMYTLSSAWNIRRTLLTAAKSFLLRPGNPSLLTVQSIIQSSVLDAYTSDSGIAEQLRKVRENSMPTEAERAEWPAELTAEEKEKLATKARKLLIQSGVPTALMGVMGQAATGEALGRVFDCLQIEEVARGLIFGLILQGVKVLTH